jgi:hypothetical protein
MQLIRDYTKTRIVERWFNDGFKTLMCMVKSHLRHAHASSGVGVVLFVPIPSF